MSERRAIMAYASSAVASNSLVSAQIGNSPTKTSYSTKNVLKLGQFYAPFRTRMVLI